MKSICYFTHIPWDWIKQRPQFIAEGLSKWFDVEVFQEKVYNSKLLSSNTAVVKVFNIFRLPYMRFAFIRKINRLLTRLSLRRKILQYQYIWFSFPLQYATMRKIINSKQVVVYDCMDDYLNFPLYKNNKSLLNEIKSYEALLMKRADFIICTSQYLKEKIISRHQILEIKNVKVINNAINIYPKDNKKKLPQHIENTFFEYPKNLCYIGTISEWFDFDTVINALEKHKEVVLLLFGPSEVSIPQHPQIIYMGIIPHVDIYLVMDRAGALIMPFILNELILSVNPVKVYEYIYAQKVSIIKRYGEVEKFENYVYLYDSSEEFYNLITKYCNNDLHLKTDKSNYLNFGKNNTWETRILEIKRELDKC